MPKALENLVGKLKGKGMPNAKAYPIATSALQKQGKLPKKKEKGKKK